MRPLSIIGGGIAGLSLGVALRQHDVPVTLYEAGKYPRHRVCGEFICGLLPETIEALSLGDALKEAHGLQSVGWYYRGRLVYESQLPFSAYGVSRYALDAQLAQQFTESGGQLKEGTRYTEKSADEGCVWSTGRRAESDSPWLGLKFHCSELALSHDLEIHLGPGCYVGLSRVEQGRVNVCGLFRRNAVMAAKKEELLLAYLQNSELNALAERLNAGKMDAQSVIGVSHISYSRLAEEQGRLVLGDRQSMIPPFTGNGMSMAFQSAEIALPALAQYARGELNWEQSVSLVRDRSEKAFRSRIRYARSLHPLIHSQFGQKMLVALAKTGLLPFKMLFQKTHF